MNRPTEQQVDEFLSRGVDQVIDHDKFRAMLLSGNPIKMYFGVDPTGYDLHIGHAVALRKMKQLQDWGHEVILLIGDFTAKIGDPTGKDKTREPLTSEQVLENAKDYQSQASKILNFEGENAIKVVYNNEWLGKLTFTDVVDLSAKFTVQQILERDMYQRRLQEGKPISLHEFLYPLMQGYDSVHLEVDMQMGGSDQLFNILAGRTLMDKLKGKESHVVTLALLEGSDGRKMSKSFNNHIPLMAEPNDMYGRVMSVKDELLVQYFTLGTDLGLDEIKQIESELKNGTNPRDVKMRLAREIVTMYHSADDAKSAEEAFINQFQKGAKPDEMEEVDLSELGSKSWSIVDLLVETHLAPSKSEARRLVEQGAVKLNDTVMSDLEAKIDLANGDILQKGKRGFKKIKLD